eukprot:TRINITY_DN64838_c0_g1_i1.p1 TRINITY_DN64838_c0_g1~~TRINITY_DN64838_c0_g1_i1.p1  ORF type:complete len:1521 (-),score=405.62 TRINITY_DN64838_c0_g1_i1:59-4621(-)
MSAALRSRSRQEPRDIDGDEYVAPVFLQCTIAVTWLVWILGISWPIVEIVPFPIMMGADPGMLQQVGPMAGRPMEKTTIGILRMLREHGYRLGYSILLTCSVIVPLVKLVVSTLLTCPRRSIPKVVSEWLPSMLGTLSALSSYQLVDLFIGILIVAFCNSESFEASLRPGFWCFGLFCVSSQAIILYLQRLQDQAADALSNRAPSITSLPLQGDFRNALSNGVVLAFLIGFSWREPVLDVAFTFEGIAFGRQTLGLQGIYAQIWERCGWALACILACTVAVAPLLVALCAMIGAKTSGAFGDRLLYYGSLLSPWVMADVFALSLVTFLFTVQGTHLHTMVPDGTLFHITSEWFSGFYLGLGMGATGVALKWRVITTSENSLLADALYEAVEMMDNLEAQRQTPGQVADLPTPGRTAPLSPLSRIEERSREKAEKEDESEDENAEQREEARALAEKAIAEAEESAERRKTLERQKYDAELEAEEAKNALAKAKKLVEEAEATRARAEEQLAGAHAILTKAQADATQAELEKEAASLKSDEAKDTKTKAEEELAGASATAATLAKKAQAADDDATQAVAVEKDAVASLKCDEASEPESSHPPAHREEEPAAAGKMGSQVSEGGQPEESRRHSSPTKSGDSSIDEGVKAHSLTDDTKDQISSAQPDRKQSEPEAARPRGGSQQKSDQTPVAAQSAAPKSTSSATAPDSSTTAEEGVSQQAEKTVEVAEAPREEENLGPTKKPALIATDGERADVAADSETSPDEHKPHEGQPVAASVGCAPGEQPGRAEVAEADAAASTVTVPEDHKALESRPVAASPTDETGEQPVKAEIADADVAANTSASPDDRKPPETQPVAVSVEDATGKQPVEAEIADADVAADTATSQDDDKPAQSEPVAASAATAKEAEPVNAEVADNTESLGQPNEKPAIGPTGEATVKEMQDDLGTSQEPSPKHEESGAKDQAASNTSARKLPEEEAGDREPASTDDKHEKISVVKEPVSAHADAVDKQHPPAAETPEVTAAPTAEVRESPPESHKGEQEPALANAAGAEAKKTEASARVAADALHAREEAFRRASEAALAAAGGAQKSAEDAAEAREEAAAAKEALEAAERRERKTTAMLKEKAHKLLEADVEAQAAEDAAKMAVKIAERLKQAASGKEAVGSRMRYAAPSIEEPPRDESSPSSPSHLRAPLQPWAPRAVSASSAGGLGLTPLLDKGGQNSMDSQPGLEYRSEFGSIPDTPREGEASAEGEGHWKWRKLFRNPIFHVKAASWIIWGLCYFCVRGPERLSYMRINEAAEDLLPILNDFIHRTVPTTIGDCGSEGPDPAPLPCLGQTPLYKAQADGMGPGKEVLVRWATGLNTIALKSVSLHVIPDSPNPIQAQLRGVIGNLSLSIRIKQCLLGVCKPLWDDTNGCCEPNRNFEIIVATKCFTDENGRASLANFKVEWFDVAKISLSENVIGVGQTSLADLTPQVRKAVRAATQGVFNGEQPVLMNWTFGELMSRLWLYNTEGGQSCEDLVGSM